MYAFRDDRTTRTAYKRDTSYASHQPGQRIPVTGHTESWRSLFVGGAGASSVW